ncbi:MAG: hypothetical protein VYE68_11195 [Acidobacteriota bacterium]|nr:hypothetical protein [Acidobacteriota bacterium]
MFGVDGRSIASAGDLLVIDQGAGDGLVPGQRLAVFRPNPSGLGGQVVPLGTAAVMLVEPTSAITQVLQTQLPIRSGDLVARHR